MTIQRTFFNWSSSGLNYNAYQYERCAPNLVQLIIFLKGWWGGYSLGCEGDRAIRTGTSPSAHSYGAAHDWRYTPVPSGQVDVSRSVAVDVILPWIINNSAELGIDAIHDYAGDRIWRAGRTPYISEAHTKWWKKQNGAGGGMGESWATYFHFETHKDRFSDSRPIRLRPGIRLPSGGTTDSPPPNITPSQPPTTYSPNATDLPAPPPSLIKGSTNANNVRWLQQLMKDVGWHLGIVDGIFGDQTVASVKRMQGTLRTTQDGGYGPITASKLAGWLKAIPAPDPAPALPNETVDGATMRTPPGIPNLKYGVIHDNVPWLQAVLSAMHTLPEDGGTPIFNPAWVGVDRYYTGASDVEDLFGRATVPALKYWQSKNKDVYGRPLTADGIYGPVTAAAMLKVRGK